MPERFTLTASRADADTGALAPSPPRDTGASFGFVWLLLTTVFVASLITWQYWDRSREMVENAMAETGNVLLMAMDGGLRGGRRSPGSMPFQFLLDELMSRDTVQFFAVTTANGIILAHSDPTRVGKRLQVEDSVGVLSNMLAEMTPGRRPHWIITEMEDRHSFVVYRMMSPGIRHHRGMVDPQGPRYMFLGMDTAPLSRARDHDRRRALLYGGSVLAFGLCVVACVYAFERLSLSRRRQREAEALMDELALTLPDGLVLLDAKGRLRCMNDSARTLLHIKPSRGEQTASDKASDKAGALPGALTEQLERLRKEGVLADTEVRLDYGDRTTYLSVRGGRVGNSREGHLGFLVLLRDVSEVRRLEAEVRRREKLAAVGNLAAGVAHELRNPLSSIKGYAAYFGEIFPEGSEERAAAQVMMHEADRLNRTITELIGLARPTDIHATRASLGDIVGDVLRLIRQDADKHGVDIEFQAGEVPMLDLDPDRIRQVVLNVCINALDAMPRGGTLTLSLFEDPALPDKVVLDVRDTGTGIPPEDLAHVFDPYFTTKGHGTGLGLATVHKIMEAHGGSVQVTSTPGQGSCFRLVFSLSPSGPTNESRPQGAERQAV